MVLVLLILFVDTVVVRWLLAASTYAALQGYWMMTSSPGSGPCGLVIEPRVTVRVSGYHSHLIDGPVQPYCFIT